MYSRTLRVLSPKLHEQQMISTYYFRAQMYTIVPHQVREDLRWMADHGSDSVIVGVIEQDLSAARENLDCICTEAAKLGLRVFATPSRWGNLVAGCPKVPSILCATDHQLWARKADGSPAMNFLGPIASVHHPRTLEAFTRLTTTLLSQWDISGIVWDEPKALEVADHSEAAQGVLGNVDRNDPAVILAAQRDFFGQVNAVARSLRPDLRIGMFLFGHYADQLPMTILAGTPGLDDFGLDGRPWAKADGGSSDSSGGEPTKFLLDQGPSFIAAAHAHGRKALALIENHALKRSDLGLMEQRLDTVLRQGYEHLIYYYYPRSCEDADQSMAILRQAILRNRKLFAKS